MKDIVFIEEPVTLGALLSVNDASLYVQNRIQTHRLPLPADRIHFVTSRYIREAVSALTNQSVVIIGKRTILLPAVFSKTWNNDFIHQFTGFLESILCKGNNRVEVEFPAFSIIGDLGREGDCRFLLQSKQEFMGFPAGETGVYVISRTYGESAKQLIFFHVNQYIPVVKAAKTLERNEALSWEKLYIIEEKLNPFMGEVFAEDEKAGDFQTVKRIDQGEIIYKSSVKKILHVRAGENVTIIIKKGTILLSMTGKAADSGTVGEPVKVRPSQSSEWIIAKVTGHREVLLEM